MARNQRFEKVHTSDPEDNNHQITNGSEQGVNHERFALQFTFYESFDLNTIRL